MKKITVIFISLLFIACFRAYGQVRVVKNAQTKNPKVIFRGVNGNAKLSQAVASDLKNCGWFDIISSGLPRYLVSGTATATSLQLNLHSANGTPLYAAKAPINVGKPRWAAHQAVDELLRKLFKIKGICTSQICFSAEIKPGIKEIYIADFDGHNARRTTRNGRLSVEPDWEPDNRRIVYTKYSKMFTDIIEYDVFSRRSRRLAQFPGLNAGAAVSPTGKHFALILSKDRKVDLYIKSVNTKWMQRLTKSTAAEASPCWSPRGDRICYVSEASGSPGIYIISARGGPAQRMRTYGSEAVSPDWSTDNQIAYSARMGRNYTIAIHDLKGENPPKTVVNAAGDWESPSWAPDNRHVICSHTLNRKSSLYIVDTWTGKARKIMGGGPSLTFPSWSGIFR